MKTIDIKTKIEPHRYLKIAEFRKHIRTTTPHKHNSYVEFVFLTAGSGTHTIDGISFRVTPPILFTIRKEQVHHWELTGEPEGYVLILKKQYIENSRDKALHELLTKARAHACLQIDSSNNLSQFFRLLLESCHQDQPNGTDVIDGLLKALLARIVQQTQPLIHAIRATDLFSRFEELLGQTDALRNNVAHYARQLNTSPQNLNAVCRKAIGQSAAIVLTNHLIGEAKRLLHYTGLTVKEIADRFDFADSSHFIKYFKKHVGMTPQTFRKQT